MSGRISLLLGALVMATWVVIGLIAPLGAGWVHLFLGAGIMLLIRAVVLWPTPATSS